MMKIVKGGLEGIDLTIEVSPNGWCQGCGKQIEIARMHDNDDGETGSSLSVCLDCLEEIRDILRFGSYR